MSRNEQTGSGKEMADQTSSTEAGEADFNVHARDYTRVMKLFKYSAIVALIAVFLILLIISN
jgi:hypothetical protein